MKIYVGMSGGVDSSVSAALLKKQGHDVTGVFIKVWQPDWIDCTWREDRLDAMRVAAQLEIPFVTLDLEAAYKKEVVDYMISEYRAGRTPNPDVMCNKYVKFGGFFDWAMEQGADAVATGHYAQVFPPKSDGGVFELVAGDDDNKDQSYFLWTLTQQQLSRTFFPVGNIEKPEVRKLAKKFDLATADKKDSQGLCFIGKIDIKDFLSRYIETQKGDVFLFEEGTTSSKIIGTHSGALFYTIGERHGFDVTVKTPDDEAYYIVAKDLAKNTITVSHKMPDGHLPSGTKVATLISTNWTRGISPKIGDKLWARSRYRQELSQITIKKVATDTCEIEFDEVQDTLSPGQSLVVYDGKVCLGGGILK
jgi:tRNA-uridine 2-sulfurtransferase